MSGIQAEWKNGYPFTPYVVNMEYENLTYSSIDLSGLVSGDSSKYTAAGFSYDIVNTFANAVDVDGNVTNKVITCSLEDLTPSTVYYVRGYTTVGGVKKYTKKMWIFTTPAIIGLGALTTEDLTDTTLTLNCSINKALDTGDTVKFQQSADAEFTSPSNIVATLTDLAFTADVTGLTSGATYYYRAVLTVLGTPRYSNTEAVVMDWTVDVTEGDNGTITCLEHVANGDPLTITLAADTGYEVNAFTVDGVNKKSEIVNGVFTITAVEDDVAIVGSFKPALILEIDNKEDKQAVFNGAYFLTLDVGDSVGILIDTVNTFNSAGLITISDATVDTDLKTFTKTYASLTPGETYFMKPFITLNGATTYGDIDTFTMAWEITATDPANGAITLNPSEQSSCCPNHFYILDGEALTITLVPDALYEVDTFTVDAVDKKASLVNNVYSIAAIEANVVIVATFKQIT